MVALLLLLLSQLLLAKSHRLRLSWSTDDHRLLLLLPLLLLPLLVLVLLLHTY